MEVGLVSCTKSKREEASIPRDLYDESTLFRKARDYCEEHHDDWYILSAKYHLLRPDGPVIEPYEETLNDATVEQRRDWSRKVLRDLRNAGLLEDEVTLMIHAGHRYYDQLLTHLQEAECRVELPLEGLRIGERFAWYNDNL